MNTTQITINVSQGGIVNINTSTPYKALVDRQGLTHVFFSKETYLEYVEELKEQK